MLYPFYLVSYARIQSVSSDFKDKTTFQFRIYFGFELYSSMSFLYDQCPYAVDYLFRYRTNSRDFTDADILLFPIKVKGVGAAGQREDPALFLREGVSLHRRMGARGAVCPNPVSAAAHLRRCDRNALPVRPDEAYFLTMKREVAAIISAAEGLGAAPDQFRVQTVVG